MHTILVTGGAGYIGSHTVKKLINDNYNVVVIDDLSSGYKDSVDSKAIFYNENINNRFELTRIIKKHKIDAVLHCAGKIIVSESMVRPFDYYRSNVHEMQILLEVMVENDIKNIMFSSTASVYGNNCLLEPATEETTVMPINPYAETKIVGENLIKWVSTQYGMNYMIFRYFNVAGAELNGSNGLSLQNPTHIIPNIVKTALGLNEKLIIFGNDYDTTDGTCIRDYIHVVDLANAHSIGMKHLLEKNESDLFNLGSKKGFSVKEIVDKAEEVLDLKVNHEYGNKRLGDPASVLANCDKATEILQWLPQYSLDDIIRSDCLWRKNFPLGHEK